MGSSRLFAYNNSGPISGASQSGDLSISNDSKGGGSVKWWVGPDEDPGYVIAYTDTSGVRTTNGSPVVGNAVGFSRTSTKNDSEFLSLVNSLSGQIFLTASVAANWLNSNGYYTSYSASSDLGTIGNPAVSAQAIYESGQTTDGWYYIKTSNMASPRQIYCNMTDEGGGWMLISYSPDNTRPLPTSPPSGIPYPNQWIGGDGSFSSKLSTDVREIWYNNGTAQCDRVMKMASPTSSLEPLLTNIQIANQVIYSNPNNLQLSATFSTSSNAVIVNNTPMLGTWLGIKGHTLMVGPLNVNAPGDWIYQANQPWWTVCGPSSQLTSDGRSGNAQGSGSWTNVGSENIYGMLNVSATTTSQRNDIRTYAVYIK